MIGTPPAPPTKICNKKKKKKQKKKKKNTSIYIYIWHIYIYFFFKEDPMRSAPRSSFRLLQLLQTNAGSSRSSRILRWCKDVGLKVWGLVFRSRAGLWPRYLQVRV